jgi:hypothetical protein
MQARFSERSFDPTALVATLIVFLLPLRAGLPVGGSVLSPGVLLALALLPVILVRAKEFSFFLPITVLVAGSVLSVPILQTVASTTHSVNAATGVGTSIVILASLVSLLALLWARSLLGVRRVAIIFGLGFSVQTLLTSEGWSGNAWKFGFAFPVVVLLLAAAYPSGRMWVTIFMLIVVSALSILNDNRSYFGFAAVVALIFIWRWNRDATVSRVQAVQKLLLFAAIAVGVYFLGIWLALQGHLGERNQLVTETQVRQGGSALAAGRVESGAAIRLFVERPFGYGAGVLPNTADVAIGQSGLVSRGADIDGTYVRDYLFGEGIKLHSVLSDLWVNFGLIGLALGIVFGVILVRSLLGLLAARTPPALPVFLVVIGLWDLLFSPIGSNLHEVIFAVAMVTPLASVRSRASLQVAQVPDPAVASFQSGRLR